MDLKSTKLKSTLRGIRKCKFCGHYNGFRAKNCKNKICFSLVNNVSQKNGWIDPIELVSNSKTKIFSVRVKERDLTLRNFVEITDTTLFAEDDYTSIVSRNAVCYADTCKYDVRDLEIICKHVKSASGCSRKASQLEIDRKIIDNLKVDQQYKDAMWNMYNKTLNCAPPLQRLNAYTFAVQCAKSVVFPAGRLHILVLPDGIHLNKLNTRYQCICKKLQTEPKVNKTYKNENFCFHILFLLTGIMGSTALKYEFSNFCNLFSNFWNTSEIDKLQENEFVNHQKKILIKLSKDEQKNITELDNIKNFEAEKINAKLECFSSEANLSKDLFFLNNFFNAGYEDLNVFDFCNTLIMRESNDKNKTEKVNVENCDLNRKISLQNISNLELLLPKYDLEKIKSTNWLNFNDWLNFVIEKINTSIQFEINKSKVVHHFNIPENFFVLLHNRFSEKDRKRLPNNFYFINFQNRKLIRQLWYFSNKLILNKIFKTDSSSIQFEKICGSDVGNPPIHEFDLNSDNKNILKMYRPIKPKNCFAFIRLKDDNEQSNFVIEWIPNVFPKSKFGVFKIEFTLGFEIR